LNKNPFRTKILFEQKSFSNKNPFRTKILFEQFIFRANQVLAKTGTAVKKKKCYSALLNAGLSDWAIFRLLGGCLLWAVFVIRVVAQISGLPYQFSIYFDKVWFGLHLGRLFSQQTHLVTLF
jgi:hypothetical protein